MLEGKKKTGSVRRKLGLTLLALLFVVAIIGAGIWAFFIRSDISVGRYAYSWYEVSSFEGQAASVGAEDRGKVRPLVISALAKRAAADDIKLKYPNEPSDIRQVAKETFDMTDEKVEPNEFQLVLAHAEQIDRYVKMSKLGGVQAAKLEFPYSRYLTEYPTGDMAKTMDRTKYQSIAAINEDKTYAQATRDAYLADIKSKKLTLAQAVKKLQADQRLVYGFAHNTSSLQHYTLPVGNIISMVGLSNDEGAIVVTEEQQQILRAMNQPDKILVEEDTLPGKTRQFGKTMAEFDSAQGVKIGWVVYIVGDTVEKNDKASEYAKKVKEYEDAK